MADGQCFLRFDSGLDPILKETQNGGTRSKGHIMGSVHDVGNRRRARMPASASAVSSAGRPGGQEVEAFDSDDG